MVIQICVGSSCHLKGTQALVELFQSAIDKYKLSGDIALAGSFCSGRCGRAGVTVTIDGEIFTGVTPEGFDEFFNKNVLSRFEGK